MPWLVRTRGIRQILHCNGDGGIAGSRGLKRAAIKLHHRAMSWPTRHIVAWSQFVKQQMLATGISDRKVTVAFGGIDTARFKPDRSVRKEWVKRFNLSEEDTIVSTISFLRRIKNPQTILEACGLLAKRALPFHLFVAGDGEMLPELQNRCRQMGIAERVHWLGKFPQPETLLQASDIFVLASIGEAFGFVTVEAMACGVPVVASRAGATPELVQDGATGLLVNPLDPDAFADAIERLLENRDLRRQMGARGPAIVRDRFQVDKAVENWMQEFARVGLNLKVLL